MFKSILLSLATVALIGCAANSTKTKKAESPFELFGQPKAVDAKILDKHPLGSIKNPIRVSGPYGQRDYLSRLVCSDGSPVASFQRQGNVGIGPFGTIVDVYEVVCESDKADTKHAVYLDMYHGDYVETRAAAGFSALKPPRVDQSKP
ncbi:MAG: hypothetical protein RL497_2748 [Pseudomonadota bacterium]|jgi:hypothetical protein